MCIYDVFGPLSLPTISSGTPFEVIAHFDIFCAERLPLRIGGKIRWIFDGSSSSPFDPISVGIGRSLLRVSAAQARDRSKTLNTCLTINCSTNAYYRYVVPLSPTQRLWGSVSDRVFSPRNLVEMPSLEEQTVRIAAYEEVVFERFSRFKFSWKVSDYDDNCSACELEAMGSALEVGAGETRAGRR